MTNTEYIVMLMKSAQKQWNEGEHEGPPFDLDQLRFIYAHHDGPGYMILPTPEHPVMVFPNPDAFPTEEELEEAIEAFRNETSVSE